MEHIFWSNIFNRPDNQLKTITALWQKTPLFADLPSRHIEFLCRTMHVRKYQADETIFHRDDQGAGAILVLEGSVRLMSDQIQLALLQTGDFFGEIALAKVASRTADAFSVDNSRLVYFLKQDLEEWVEYEPRLGARFLMNLSSTLAQRLYQANQLLGAQRPSA